MDILAGRVYRDRVADDGRLVPVHHYDLPGTVAAIAPIEGDDGWLVAFERGVSHLALDGTLTAIADFAPDDARTNDAACDPQGRLWVGTKAHDNRAGGGALYRLDRDGTVEQMLDGLTISNGLGWSLDGATMYLIDTIPGVIHAFAFDAPTGAIADGRALVEVPAEHGGPDGMTVDAGGDLWVAMFGGSRVVRYAPDGTHRASHPVPAAQVTCCAFGGRDLRWLYVTTATEDWTDERRRAEPGAGLVYRLDAEGTGRPAAPFRPDPAWWAEAVPPARR